MDALSRAFDRSNAMINTVRSTAGMVKAAEVDQGGGAGFSGYDAMRSTAANKERYSLFHGWLYSAVHAIATRGSRQPVQVGTMVQQMDVSEEERRGGVPNRKFVSPAKLPPRIRAKAIRGEVQPVPGHPMMATLEKPNNIQTRTEFVYSFLASLCLTGWSYVLGDENETTGKMELYTLPTTWVHPDHKEGPFSRFKITNPRNPSGGQNKWFDRSQICFSHIPNPSDPLSAISPAASQIRSIRMDDQIQTSQERFFQNGIFPSVIVTIGKNPQPNMGGGVGGQRPRLGGNQRRSIEAAITRMMSSVANYGTPAIVDGLVEGITPLSMNQTEMGWDKSEDKVRARLLSAYGVHDYILGNPVDIGGYAQAANIEKIFCERVNALLDMLSCMITNFLGVDEAEETHEKIVVWWNECEAHDPNQRRLWFETGRKNNDVTRNEFRAEVGLAPVEGGDGERNKLLDNPVALASVAKMLSEGGRLTEKTADNLLALFLGEEARAIVDEGELDPTPLNPNADDEPVPVDQAEQMQQIADNLQAAVNSLAAPVQVSVDEDAINALAARVCV